MHCCTLIPGTRFTCSSSVCFMLFWVMNFIIALGQMTLAGAFAFLLLGVRQAQGYPGIPGDGVAGAITALPHGPRSRSAR